ncbi:MAG: CHAT domain-containing protein [Acidimicrobiia bacterium]|nr:CHAT domain-containing protein [Acidimicrobiia bacterium]
MIAGAYSSRPGGGGRFLPHIVQVTIAVAGRHEFVVAIHEEGTGLTFRQAVTLDAADERRLLGLPWESMRAGSKELDWAAPPYLVVNSACQSARSAQGTQLVSPGGRANGLPGAFLANGCQAYVGHFWPIGDRAAADFAGCFYDTLFREVNAGLAVLDARRAVRPRYDDTVDLAAFGAVFFGDVGSEHDRRDLAESVPPDDDAAEADPLPPPDERRDLAQAV